MKIQLKTIEKIINFQAISASVAYWLGLPLCIGGPIFYSIYLLTRFLKKLPLFSEKILGYIGHDHVIASSLLVTLILAVMSLVIPLRFNKLFFRDIQAMFICLKNAVVEDELIALGYLNKANRSLFICVVYSYATIPFGLLILPLEYFRVNPALSKAAVEAANEPVSLLKNLQMGDYVFPSLSGFAGLTLFLVISYAAKLWEEKIQTVKSLAVVSEELNLTI